MLGPPLQCVCTLLGNADIQSQFADNRKQASAYVSGASANYRLPKQRKTLTNKQSHNHPVRSAHVPPAAGLRRVHFTPKFAVDLSDRELLGTDQEREASTSSQLDPRLLRKL